MSQIPRRAIDRFLGRFVKLRRFHCQHCDWQGNLPIRGKTRTGQTKPAKTFFDGLLVAVLVAILISLVTMTAMFAMAWFDGRFENPADASARQALSDIAPPPIRPVSPGP